MKVVPLGERVVVKRLESEEVTAGGIVLPDTAKEKPLQGRVLNLPSREEVPIPIREELIVEFCSR